ncbi:hypothetical protein [Actinomadura madurae]|uniref:hypothetical protein n=1 Tax=Actinomadura madurae TaxID=1993 RepID=UPI0020D232DF|nr:hypothetical protein [Actinomadura madurae]MCP9982396.1 hypothetical protein [Actinomadura madurae]
MTSSCPTTPASWSGTWSPTAERSAAARRRERTRRLARPFTRFGVAIPIIAGALLVALLSGVLMTAFGPRPASRPTGAQLAPRPSASPGEVGGLLPDRQVDLVAGDHTPKRLIDLRPGVIAIAPPGYRCENLVAELAAGRRRPR